MLTQCSPTVCNFDEDSGRVTLEIGAAQEIFVKMQVSVKHVTTADADAGGKASSFAMSTAAGTTASNLHLAAQSIMKMTLLSHLRRGSRARIKCSGSGVGLNFTLYIPVRLMYP